MGSGRVEPSSKEGKETTDSSVAEQVRRRLKGTGIRGSIDLRGNQILSR